jgi:tetratricopeptide (TPR) repeat protein
MMLAAKSDYAGAEPLLRRALAINEKALGPDHPDTVGSLNSLAVVLELKGDYAGAEPLYRRALAIDEKALGPDHPDTKAIRNHLAEVKAKAK